MSGHQTGTINDTIYFWFAANDTSGSGGDGATPLYDVREAGAAAGAGSLLSGTPTLLTSANFPAGCYEVAIAATTGNGFAANDTFAVFCTIAIDSQNPSGFIGSCTLTPLAKASGVVVNSIDNNAITAAAINADAITSAKIADNAFVAANFAASSLNGKGDWNIGKTGYSLTALPAISANWLTAAGIAASALDGKGDWNIGKTGYTLTTQDWNTVVPPSVAQFNARTLLSAEYATEAELDKVPKSDGAVSWNATTLAAINVQADLALTDIHLDHLFDVDYDPASKPGVSTALLNELIENNGGVSRYTAAALAEAPSGTGGDASAANQTLILEDLVDIKGTSFIKDTHSLIDIMTNPAWNTATGFATEAKQDAQDAIITEARLAELDAGNLPASVDAIPTTPMRGTDGANTVVPDAAGVAPTLSEIIAGIWGDALPGSYTIGEAGYLLGKLFSKTSSLTASDTASICTDSTLSESNDHWNGMSVFFHTGNNAGTARRIDDYDFATKSYLMDTPFPNATTSGDEYSVIPTPPVQLAANQDDYAPNIVVPPTAVENRQEMDSNSTELAKVGTIPALDGAAQTIGAAIAKIADDNGGADFNAATDSLQEIRDQGDAAWITGANPTLMQSTTITGLTSQTVFQLTAGSADDDAYNNQMVIIEDAATSTQKCYGLVLNYVGSTKEITLLVDPGIFTIANTDNIDIIAITGSSVGLEVDASGFVQISGTKNQLDDLNDLSTTQVNAEVADVLFTDTDAEPPQGAPGATISVADKIGYLYKAWRNRATQTATEYKLYNDDATTVDQKATVSDNATTADKGEVATGP